MTNAMLHSAFFSLWSCQIGLCEGVCVELSEVEFLDLSQATIAKAFSKELLSLIKNDSEARQKVHSESCVRFVRSCVSCAGQTCFTGDRSIEPFLPTLEYVSLTSFAS